MERCLYGPLQQILENTPSVQFFDYMTKPEYQKEEYFRNALMMNAKGRKKFTVELLRELNVGESEKC